MSQEIADEMAKIVAIVALDDVKTMIMTAKKIIDLTKVRRELIEKEFSNGVNICVDGFSNNVNICVGRSLNDLNIHVSGNKQFQKQVPSNNLSKKNNRFSVSTFHYETSSLKKITKNRLNKNRKHAQIKKTQALFQACMSHKSTVTLLKTNKNHCNKHKLPQQTQTTATSTR